MAWAEKEITGWSFATLENFEDANNDCDTYFGFPQDPEMTTQTSMSVLENIDSTETLLFYYVGWHPQLEEVLGAPSVFNVWVEYPE